MNIDEKIAAFNFSALVETRYTDMDMLGHANNAVYLIYFEEARSAYWKEVIRWDWKALGIVLVKSEVEYLVPVLLNEQLKIYVRTSRVGKSSFDLEYAITTEEKEHKILKTIGRTTQVVIDYQTKKSVLIPAKERLLMIEFDKAHTNHE